MLTPNVADPPTIPLWIYWIGVLVPTIISSIGLYIAIRKAPFEIQQTKKDIQGKDIDIAVKLQEIANNATDENNELRTELSLLRKSFDDYKKVTEENIIMTTTDFNKQLYELRLHYEQEIDILKMALFDSQAETRLYRNWSERLVSQLFSLDPDIKPVPIEPKRYGYNTSGCTIGTN
jgi:hypothetical protein